MNTDKAIYKIFIRENGCPKCHEALEYCKALQKVELQIYDIDLLNGLAEASYYGVLSTPTIVMVDDKDEEINRYKNLEDWRDSIEKEK